MTQRERHASAGLSATPPLPHAPGVSAGPSTPSRLASAPETRATSLWEEVFHNATPLQRQELLSLASRQGLLYAHQLPHTANGSRPHAAPTDQPCSLNLLSRLFQGQTAELQPIRPAPIEPVDLDLDEVQRQAVARALETPDLCLIQGLPGTGKSRVLAEVVTQAAARGERVLLLAPGTAGLDRVLGLVSGQEVVCPIRCLGKGERLEDLPAPARAATFPERVRNLRDHALAQAVRAREQAERRCQALRQEEAAWPRLEELAHRAQALREQIEAVVAIHARIPGDVRAEAERAADADGAPEGDFATSIAAAVAALRATLERLVHARTSCDQDHAERTRLIEEQAAAVEAVRPRAEAKRTGRWWSPSWWAATFGGNPLARLAELESRCAESRAKLAKLEAQRGQLDAEQAAAEESFRADRDRLVQGETTRRQAEVDRKLTAFHAQSAALDADWAGVCTTFIHAAHCPARLSVEAVGTARALWQVRQQEDEQHCTFARQWAAYLEQSVEGLATRLPGYANLVTATTTGLAEDEHFGDPASCGGLFDLLLVDEAEQISEGDLLRLARRARRWVLVGESPSAPEATPARGRASNRGSPTPLARTQVFHRLWQTLHCDPARLPYAWSREGERLCSRLRQLAPEQRQWLESERVADWPDVELRILASPRVRPLLVEVLFPASVSVAQGKEYIYRELQELPVVAAERSPRWTEEADRVVLWLTDVGSAEVETVALEPGVREVVAGSGGDRPWYTCRLEFDRQAGWERARAEAWVEGHLHLRDLGRTVRLETVHRMAGDLAEVVSDLLYEGAHRVAPGGARGGGIEFVPVPSLGHRADTAPASRGRERRRDQSAVATRSEPRTQQAAFPRGGAGLEVDLATTGQGDRLPIELRAALPRRGVVNLAEAQAVVRRLEHLSADEGLWSTEPSGVAVVALYRAQAELIRRLVRESPVLAKRGLPVEVNVPGAFRQREFSTVLVSLTRSHSHRAVSFGEETGQLTVALTRARRRLILFGDPGTLARREQWEGVLDHLDEAAAAREGLLVGRLVRYLQGGGRASRAFRLGEGGGP
jgi:hypothetical protein